MKLALALIPLLAAFQDPPAAPDYQAEVKSLRADYQKQEQEYNRQVRAAKTQAERSKIPHPALEFLPRFQELSKKAKGTEGGASAQFEIVQMGVRIGKKAEAKGAVEALVGDYPDSPILEKLASNLGHLSYQLGEDSCREALKTIRDKSPHAKAKASALLSLGILDSDARPADARASLIRLKDEFADTPYAAKADPYLFEIDHLQVGQVAPDFEATDEKGEKFKLSDFRGKVTVIDFWGFW